MSRRFGGEMYVIAVAVLVVVGVGAILGGQEDQSDASAATTSTVAGAALPTLTAPILSPTATERLSPTSTPSSTATPLPTATPDILAGAKLRTEDDAVALAREYARGLGAEQPRLVSVELVKVGQLPESIDLAGSGWDTADLVWVVQFDNDEFMIDSCEPPYHPTPWPKDGSGHSCGTLPTAVFVFSANDGLLLATWLGAPVPVPI